MTKQSILIATIGTRDLAFLSSDQEWLNVGNDRTPDIDTLCQQVKVQWDLHIDTTSFREITQHLFENLEIYLQKIEPIIIGQLLEDESKSLTKIYLIATNQPLETFKNFREKDTIYSAEIIKRYIGRKYDIPTEIIEQCTKGENPANFDQMFLWWQHLWKNLSISSDCSILLCLKGGVNQSSEAARITALSKFEDDCFFYDFHQDEFRNKQGKPSLYTQISGGNYLWDRRQKQALKLLDRYDYSGAFEILKSYFKQDTKGWSNIPNLVRAGISYNQGQFNEFASLAESALDKQQKGQLKQFWWMAYEQAYTAIIRFEQQNTAEAMLHSFRAIEGLIFEWTKNTFSNHLTSNKLSLKSSICQEFPAFKTYFNNGNQINLERWIQQKLLEAEIPKARNDLDFQAWGSEEARYERNRLSHQLGGISEKELFFAWGKGVNSKQKWEERLLNCLNLITGQKFKTLAQSSLFACVHHQVKNKIINFTFQ